MWLRLTLNPILPKLVLDNRQLPFIFVFCSHIPPFAATVTPTGSPHILISAVPSDIKNSAVNTFMWNQQTSETSVIERVWGDYWEATFSLSASYRLFFKRIINQNVVPAYFKKEKIHILSQLYSCCILKL